MSNPIMGISLKGAAIYCTRWPFIEHVFPFKWRLHLRLRQIYYIIIAIRHKAFHNSSELEGRDYPASKPKGNQLRRVYFFVKIIYYKLYAFGSIIFLIITYCIPTLPNNKFDYMFLVFKWICHKNIFVYVKHV